MRFDIRPSILVIFGATGDLTRRKLMPALFDLHQKGVLPKQMKIIGFSRRKLTDGEFRKMARKAIETDAGKFFAGVDLQYVRGDFTRIGGFEELKKILGLQDETWKFCSNKLFYLAVPPRHYSVLLENLGASGLTEPCGPDEGWTRVILEKPFGRNLATAQALDEKLARLFREEQIFRIDHFLGKESLQNILAFRFGNAIFEPVWNNRHIDHVQIIVAETLGMEGRGAFYDDVGALRDMVQSHLLQMSAVVAMERPRDFSADAIRDERAKILKSLTGGLSGSRFKVQGSKITNLSRNRFAPGASGLKRDEVAIVRGQYRGYRGEKGVADNSRAETFAALKFYVDNDRWRSVPFYLMTGKKLRRGLTRIVIDFKAATSGTFAIKRTQVRAKVSNKEGSGGGLEKERKQEQRRQRRRQGRRQKNRIIFEMKPAACVTLEVLMKEPGLRMRLASHTLKLDYGKAHNHALLDAYEKLLIDCMSGDQTLFARTDEVMAAWKFVMPLLETWRENEDRGVKGRKWPLAVYEPDSWGPAGAKRLIEQDGRKWYFK